MKRNDIKLRRAARQGDAEATLALARRYLAGDGMPRHVATGLAYLAPYRSGPEAATMICHLLSLQELIEYDQVDILTRHAGESREAGIKLAVWQVIRGATNEGIITLEKCVPDVKKQVLAWNLLTEERRFSAVLQYVDAMKFVDGAAVAYAAAKRAWAEANLEGLSLMLRLVVELRSPADDTRGWIYRAVTLSNSQGRPLHHLTPDEVQDAIESAVLAGDTQALFILGLALCGLPCGPNPSAVLVRRENLRRGTALLVRAADSGHGEAWLHLQKLHSNPRCSVANPEMGRFCLEKAAAAGYAEAQRRLGALMLRESVSVETAERAVTWLHLAATQGDTHALELMRTLVLPVDGSAHEADAALFQISRHDPLMSARLRVAREFGLTKQEAMCIDFLTSVRPWGLVTSVSPYLSHRRLSAARVVPAVRQEAVAALQEARGLFSRAGVLAVAADEPPKRQYRRLAQLQWDETLFFSDANSAERDRVRIGTRWAHHERARLNAALA